MFYERRVPPPEPLFFEAIPQASRRAAARLGGLPDHGLDGGGEAGPPGRFQTQAGSGQRQIENFGDVGAFLETRRYDSARSAYFLRRRRGFTFSAESRGLNRLALRAKCLKADRESPVRTAPRKEPGPR
jgi:hypothetical protein